MNAQRVRIVVGEGRSSQHGLLRFVLDGEGYDVVADAANPAELARVLAAHKPDVVVLDDGIGATAVGMVREMVPAAKIVLVWPGAVVPIGGAAQVTPSRVLQELGPAVARVTGVAGVTAASAGAALVDEAKRDPDGLRRLIRNAGATAAAGAIIVDGETAPVVILPVTPQVDDDIVTVPDAVEPTGAATAGAAAAGAGRPPEPRPPERPPPDPRPPEPEPSPPARWRQVWSAHGATSTDGSGTLRSVALRWREPSSSRSPSAEPGSPSPRSAARHSRSHRRPPLNLAPDPATPVSLSRATATTGAKVVTTARGRTTIDSTSTRSSPTSPRSCRSLPSRPSPAAPVRRQTRNDAGDGRR